MPSQKTDKPENKTENLKQEIDKWVEEFKNDAKKFERFDLYSGEQLSLGLLAYKDEKGQVTVLISIHGQKPTNSVSFPISGLEDAGKIVELLKKYEDVFKYIEKYEQNVKSMKKRKNLIE